MQLLEDYIERHPECHKRIKSLEIKKAAIADIDSGRLTVKEALFKYGIGGRGVLKYWRKQLGLPSPIPGRVSKNERRWAVMQIQSGKMSRLEVMEKFGVRKETVDLWKLKFSGDLRPLMKKEKSHAREVGAADEVESIEEENNHLKQVVEDLRLQILGLETMIEVAEVDLGVGIRKKFGVKRSE